MSYAPSPQPPWPELPATDFVRGRLATEADVEQMRAVFAGNVPGAKPLEIDIPQYAIFQNENEGAAVRAIVVQAETALGRELVGLVDLTGRSHMQFLSDVQLLGTRRPA
ncbi:hypothetical protein [Caulobacter sp. LARHSG274]